MTRKEKLNQYIGTLKRQNDTYARLSFYLNLEFALPYSDGEVCERITVEPKYLLHKLDYINANYDDDLVMKHNPKVKIIDFY